MGGAIRSILRETASHGPYAFAYIHVLYYAVEKNEINTGCAKKQSLRKNSLFQLLPLRVPGPNAP